MGDALEGIDLGGLTKLGFQVTDGFESDREDDKQGASKQDSDSYGSEGDEGEESKTLPKRPRDKQQKMPPTLYSYRDGRKVLELSSLFIPDRTGPARKVRENMLMFNQAIINADMGRPLAHLTKAQWIENRSRFMRGLHESRKMTVQKLNSERALEQATGDFNYLTGKRSFTEAMIFEREDPRYVAQTAQMVEQSNSLMKRARFSD